MVDVNLSKPECDTALLSLVDFEEVVDLVSLLRHTSVHEARLRSIVFVVRLIFFVLNSLPMSFVVVELKVFVGTLDELVFEFSVAWRRLSLLSSLTLLAFLGFTTSSGRSTLIR